MAKNNRPGTEDSGFMRRTLAAASLVTALSGAANAQGNKAPDAPESEAAQIVEIVKKDVRRTQDLGLGFSQEDLRKVNESGKTFSHRGNGYSTKTELKQPRFEPVPPTIPQDGASSRLQPVPQLMFSTANGDRIGGSFDPQTGQAAASYEANGKYRADFGVIRDIGTVKDTRLKASFQALYAASQLGTYVGIEKGSELSKFVVAQGFKVEGGKLQMTAALLKKLTEVHFGEVGVTEKTKLTQKAVGVDHTRGFGRESLLQEIKTSVVYYDVDGKNLGTIGHIVVDTATLFDQTRVDGGIRWGKKLLAEIGAVIKITETVRADASIGAEHIRYDAMFDTPAKSKTGATGGLGLTYQPDKQNKFSVKGRASGVSTGVDLRYEHDFGNGVSGFVEAGKTRYSTGIAPETRVMAGINVALDGGKGRRSTIAPLYTDWQQKTALTLTDLNPNQLVATSEIQVMERVIYKEHEIRIDKTALPGTSFLEYKKSKNDKNILEALNIDTGANNLVSVSSSNLSAPYSGYLSVSWGRYLRIANLEAFSKIAPFTINTSLADSGGTFTIVSVAIQKGSAVVGSLIERLNGVSAEDAAAFVAGTKTIAQILAGAANTAPTASDVGSQAFNEDGSVTVNVTVGDAQTAAGSLTFSASSNNATLFPPGSIVLGGSGANRTITLNPAANVSGTATVSYTVTDAGGMSVTKSFLVTVNAVDDAPIFGSAQGNLSLTQSTAMGATVLPLATDIDSGSLTYSLTGLSAGLSFDAGTRTLSGTPTVAGTFNVTYSVTDGTNTVTQNFQIVVDVAQVPPVMGDVPNQTGATGTAFTLNLASYVTITNGDAILGYAIASGSLPPGLSLNTATGAITGTPTTIGTYNVTVLSYDNDGNSNTDAIQFNISDGVAPATPTITAGYPTITSANSVSVQVNGEVGASVWVNGNNTGSVIGAGGNVSVSLDTSGADGAKNFSITLKDGNNNESSAASVSITADRTPPTTVSAPVSGVSHNAATATFTIDEAGTGYYLVLPSVSPAPSAATVFSTGTSVALSANAPQAVSLSGLSASTSYVVYFVAKDARNVEQISVTSTSFNTSATPNTAPEITIAATNQTVGKNNPSAANLTVNDAESGAAAVTVTATSSNQSIVQNSNIVVSVGADGARTITVTPEAGATGTVTINYIASDGSLSTNGSYTVTFTNSAPVISSTISTQNYDQSIAISTLTLPIANDSDSGESLTYSVTGLPAGLSFNPMTRQITGTPTASGSFSVTYTVTDGSGATDVKNFTINVSANVAPVIVSNGLYGGLVEFMGLNYTQPTTIQISDTGNMTVTLTSFEGGKFTITNANGGTVSGNGTANVTITGVPSGTIGLNYTSPASYQSWVDMTELTVTDSGGLSTTEAYTYWY